MAPLVAAFTFGLAEGVAEALALGVGVKTGVAVGVGNAVTDGWGNCEVKRLLIQTR